MKKSSGINNLLKKYTTPNARAGARSNNRFSFQEGWSLSRILEVHDQQENYVAVFDAFEDFIIFFETQNLSDGHFYQIKSREDLEWKITHITSKSPSIAQKLFNNISDNPQIYVTQYLVLNGEFEISVTGNVTAPEEFCFDTIDTADSKKIEKKIKTTNTLTYKTFATKAHCIRTSLPIDEDPREQIIKGKLADFIESQYAGHAYIIGPIFDCLKVEISRRSKYEKKISNSDELVKKKGITKEQFSDFISTGVQKTEVNEWQAIKIQLQGETVDLKTLDDIGKGFTDLSIELPKDRLSLKRLADDIRAKIELELPQTTRLIDLINKIYHQVRNNNFAQGYDEKLIKALVGYEYQKR